MLMGSRVVACLLSCFIRIAKVSLISWTSLGLPRDGGLRYLRTCSWRPFVGELRRERDQLCRNLSRCSYLVLRSHEAQHRNIAILYRQSQAQTPRINGLRSRCARKLVVVAKSTCHKVSSSLVVDFLASLPRLPEANTSPIGRRRRWPRWWHVMSIVVSNNNGWSNKHAARQNDSWCESGENLLACESKPG